MMKRKVLTIVLVMVMTVTAAFSLAGCGKEPIAEIPDPQYFFHNTHDELNEHDDVKQVILRSETDDLWMKAAAYVNLLKYSGKYQFDTHDETLYTNGDYRWDFEYTGPEEVEDAYFSQIEITYFKNTDGRDTYAVWITLHDLDNFELVENDIYDPDNIYGTEAYVPETQATESNADYFQTTPTTDSSSWADDDWDSDSSDDSDTDWAWEDDNDDLYDAKPICGVCNGDGDCGTCGGDGLLHSSASDEEDRNCYSCSGSGNCRSCGGDGEL